MVSSLVYSNARVKALENEILNNEKLTRMCYSATLQDAVKILLENSYGGGMIIDNPYEYEKLLRAEDERVNDFLREVMPDKSGLEVLLLKLDYHNAKALMKAKIQGVKTAAETLTSAGLVPIELLANGINENANSLPKQMSDAIEVIKNANISVKVSPRFIDVVLDKAYFDNILEIAAKCKSKAIKKYVKSSIDIANVSLFFRCKRIENRAMFDEAFVDGGSIDRGMLGKTFDQNYDAVLDKLRYTEISTVISESADELRTGKLVAFERVADNYIMHIFKNDRNDIFSVAPLAGFYIAKKTEIKCVRLILVGIKNSIGIEGVKERMRENYA